MILPIPPRTDPSPLDFPPTLGAFCKILSAILEKGKLCKYKVPVPFMVAKNRAFSTKYHRF